MAGGAVRDACDALQVFEQHRRQSDRRAERVLCSCGGGQGPAAAASCIRLSADFCSVRFEDRAAAPDGSLPEHASAGCLRNLLQCSRDVTLSPTMGVYLDMVN